VTIGVTVYGLPTKGPSQRKPLDMGSVTTVTVVTMNCRGSLNGVRYSAVRSRNAVMGREYGERKGDKARRCSRPARP